MLKVTARLSRACIGLSLVLLPLAAAIAAVQVAPPARLSNLGLDGVNARVYIDFGSNIEQVNSGLLGGLRREGPTILGKHIGVDIRPTDVRLSLFHSDGSLDTSTIDVAGHLFSDGRARDAELNRATDDVVRHFATVAAIAGYILASAEILGFAYLRRRRRILAAYPPRTRTLVRADRRFDRRIGIATVAVVVAVCVVPAGYAVSPVSNHRTALQPDSELFGTFLQGWQITGPFKDLIVQAINTVDSLGKQESQFYDEVSTNLTRAITSKYGPQAVDRNSDVVRIALLDDLQGTSGMARIVGEAAHAYGADAILNLGDITATGTAQEAYLSYLKSYTIDVLASYADKIPVYTSLGRHDTPTVAKYEKKVKFTVADSTVGKIAGLSTLGMNSPYIVNFGEAAKLIDPAVTTESVAAATSKRACVDKPFLVYAHDRELLADVESTGCVPLVIGGHSYDGESPTDVITPAGVTRRVVLASTGGHGVVDGIGGLSSPRNNAPFLILSIDKKTGDISVDTITVTPSADVTISTTALTALSRSELAKLKS